MAKRDRKTSPTRKPPSRSGKKSELPPSGPGSDVSSGPGSGVGVMPPPPIRVSRPRAARPANLSEKQHTADFTLTKREALEKKAEAERVKAAQKEAAAEVSRKRTLIETLPFREELVNAPKRNRTLSVTEHKDLPRGTVVKLYPVPRTEDDLLKTIGFSSLQRTPSPYGNRMGDHLTFWQGELDNLRFRLYDKTIDEAAEQLLEMQQEAQEWMSAPDSFGMTQFDRLPDADSRVKPLENYAYHVAELCDVAMDDGSTDKEAKDAFSGAVGQFLAYQNFLPYTTVRAATERGSTGSGEGASRKVLIAFEKEGIAAAEERRRLLAEQADSDESRDDTEEDEPREALDEDDPMRQPLDDALWNGFAFDAAIRESDIWYVLDPSIVESISGSHQQLKDIADGLRNLTRDLKKVDTEAIATLRDQAESVMKQPGAVRDVHLAAGRIKDAADRLLGLWGTGEDKPPTRRQVREQLGKIDEAVLLAAGAVAVYQSTADQALERCADVLGSKLHQHQETMVAYTRAVVASDFLTIADPATNEANAADAAHAATRRLEQALRTLRPALFAKGDPARLTEVLDAVAARHREQEPIVVPPPNDWAAHAARTELTVEFKPLAKPKVKTDGRPATPAGIAGMGSHTTAWAIEKQHPDAVMMKAKNEKACVTALGAAVRSDLSSTVMQLDALLPYDQLEAGQIGNILAAAYEVLTAGNGEQATTAYLTFRNALPYATVDAGDRTFHGEDENGKEGDTFDTGSLRHAITLKSGELANPKHYGAETKLAVAIEDLKAALAEKPPTGWASNPALAAAARASINRLTITQTKLRTPAATPVDAEEIMTVRRAEHKKVWNEVQRFRKTLSLPS
ncbi:hypothetical protein GCM10009733_042210 [Nonomuraea maheshkhaliensis]|uniref:Uncharacterized protein n=1 Tax=Nonomuraea maheshkhaliensis TaxID=419590 RepID=A0ABN2FEC5_9ACTN